MLLCGLAGTQERHWAEELKGRGAEFRLMYIDHFCEFGCVVEEGKVLNTGYEKIQTASESWLCQERLKNRCIGSISPVLGAVVVLNVIKRQT